MWRVEPPARDCLNSRLTATNNYGINIFKKSSQAKHMNNYNNNHMHKYIYIIYIGLK